LSSLAVLALLLASPAAAGTLSGTATVIDADTIRIGSTTIRLKGVDASEAGTARGDAATAAMRAIVNGGALRCELTGERTWSREVGTCFTADGTDINREIVRRGAALACPRFSTRYVSDERPMARLLQSRAHYCVAR
jgi:endonuclease YncB( thermonuclease family)